MVKHKLQEKFSHPKRRKSLFRATLPVDYITKKCLLCLDLYHPQGIGDRVCPTCKDTIDWKQKMFVGPYFNSSD